MYRYVFISICLIVVLSCDDKLDIVQPDVLSAEIAIQSLEDLELALIGAYSTLRSGGLYRESMVYLPDILADNMRIGPTNGGRFRTQTNWLYTAGNDIGVWEEGYQLIFRANTVINNADQFEDGPFKNRIVGQAHALRALGHFDLLRYYGKEYNRNSAELAVPVITFFEIGTPPRATTTEVYEQVFDDLDKARTMLGDVDEDIQENGPYFMDQRAVLALLARVSLYAEEWEDAADYASQVISTNNLASISDYPGIWKEDDVNDEVLFSVLFATRDEGTLGSRLYDVVLNLPQQFTYTASLGDLYDKTNDIRFSTFVLEDTETISDNVYLTIKYPGRGGENGLNNAKVLRVSEMYLIRAEAYTNINGRDADAMADLNTLRSSRISAYAAENLSGEQLKEAIQVERRKELVAEGHRWFDLRRTNQAVNRGEDCRGITLNCTLQPGDFRFVYPIPQDEILANPNMKQNDGY